jgi:hypothetical protein
MVALHSLVLNVERVMHAEQALQVLGVSVSANAMLAEL